MYPGRFNTICSTVILTRNLRILHLIIQPQLGILLELLQSNGLLPLIILIHDLTVFDLQLIESRRQNNASALTLDQIIEIGGPVPVFHQKYLRSLQNQFLDLYSPAQKRPEFNPD